MLRHWYHKYTSAYNIYTTRWVCQSITPTETFTCASATFFCTRQGSPTGTLYIELYAADGSGNPTGAALASKVADYANEWGFATAPYWIRAPVRVFWDTPVTLNSGTQYVILARMTGGDSSNCIGIGYTSSGDYAGGNMKYSTNSGSTWSQYASYDLTFDLWDSTADGVEYIATMPVGSAGALVRVHRGTIGSTITGSYGVGGSTPKLCKTSKYLYLGGTNVIRRFSLDLTEDTDFALTPGGTIIAMAVSETQNLLAYTSGSSGGNYGVYDLTTKTRLWNGASSMSCVDISETQDEVVFGYSPGSGGYWNGYRIVATTGVSIFNFWVSAINLRGVNLRQSDRKVYSFQNNTSGNIACRLYDETGNTYQWGSGLFSAYSEYINKTVYYPEDGMLYVACNRNATSQKSLYKMTHEGVVIGYKDLGSHSYCVAELDSDNLLVSGYAADDGGGVAALRVIRKSDLAVLWRFDPDINIQITACDVLIIDKPITFTITGKGAILIEADAESIGEPAPIDDVVFPSDETDIVNLPPIAYRPESPVVEHLVFKTQINASINNDEERISLRKCPRIEFEWNIAEGKQPMENLLFGQAMDYMAAPFWHEPAWLTQTFSGGSDTAYVSSTAYSQFKAGQWALAIRPDGRFDLLKIASVGANSLTFENLPSYTYKQNHEILPVSRCVIEDVSVTKRMGHAVYDVKVLVEPIDNDLGVQPYTPGELVITNVNYLGQSKETYRRPFYRADAPFGGFSQTVLWDHAGKGMTVGFSTHSRSELWELRKMLYRLGGRYIPFFLATFDEELTPSLGIDSGGTTLTIEACGYTDFAQGRRGKIRVHLTSGSVIERVVLSSVYISSTVERLTVNEEWGETATAGEIDRIEYLDLVRLDSDDIVITHQNAIGNARCEVPVAFVDCQWIPEAGNPIGLLLSLTYPE